MTPGSARAGRYVLLLDLRLSVLLSTRSGRTFDLRSGTYAYVGSAAGPGGVAARLGRYLRPLRRPHWHIDYLLAVADPFCALCFGITVTECRLATAFGRLDQASPVDGFGCTDCRCPTHLFRLKAFAGPSRLLADLVDQDAALRQAFAAQLQLTPSC
ncbi:MAG: GIY-YIG nuclease family protein [Anaerolineae bacterium]|nr:GIY-YIG nuclease family protein [Anaerolineae bacterium]